MIHIVEIKQISNKKIVSSLARNIGQRFYSLTDGNHI